MSPKLADLPPEVMYRIFRFLNCLDIVRCSSTCQYWRWLLTSGGGIDILRRDASTWTWLDRHLGELLGAQPLLLSNNSIHRFASAFQYRQHLNLLFHQICAKFHFPCEIIAVDSVLLGPAIDTPAISTDFLQVLLTSMDAGATTKLKSSRLNKNRIPGWSGQAIAIRIPLSGTRQNIPGHMAISLTTLHARCKLEREAQPDNYSRMANSLLLDQIGDSERSSRLTSEAVQLLTSTQLVIYAVDSRSSSSISLSRTSDDEGRWREVRCELSKISDILRSDQTLLILGIGSKNVVGSRMMLAVEILNKLGGVSASPEQPENFQQPLAGIRAKWRIWCVYSDGDQYANINEVLQWAFIDAVVQDRISKERHYIYNPFSSSFWNFIPQWLSIK